MTDAIPVTVESFSRAETDRMFASLAERAGGSNRLHHDREPSSVDDQRVIRQNRDTLYSLAIVDIRDGATLTLPDAGDRYMSVMIVNEDHYINRVFHSGGTYQLTQHEFDTPWVLVASRILVDPTDPADVSAVNALQDELKIETASTAEFEMPDYDKDSFDEVRDALLTLSRHMGRFRNGFGKRTDVDPVLHLIGTANGWGGLPDDEASYATIEPNLPVGDYEITVQDVPVDAFWSISVYNKAGFFEKNHKRRLQHQQCDRHQERGRLYHDQIRRRRPAQHHSDHGRLELCRPPLPPAQRDPRRQLALPASHHHPQLTSTFRRPSAPAATQSVTETPAPTGTSERSITRPLRDRHRAGDGGSGVTTTRSRCGFEPAPATRRTPPRWGVLIASRVSAGRATARRRGTEFRAGPARLLDCERATRPRVSRCRPAAGPCAGHPKAPGEPPHRAAHRRESGVAVATASSCRVPRRRHQERTGRRRRARPPV